MSYCLFKKMDVIWTSKILSQILSASCVIVPRRMDPPSCPEAEPEFAYGSSSGGSSQRVEGAADCFCGRDMQIRSC